jgi:hypothetical protein
MPPVPPDASEPPVVLPLDPELLPPILVLPELPLPEDPEPMPLDDPELPELIPLEDPELPVPDVPEFAPSLLQAPKLPAKIVTTIANLTFSMVFIFVSCEV